MPTEPFSFVLEFPAASPEDARGHFLSRLAVETDVSDVATDLERKRGDFVVIDVRNQKAYKERHVPEQIHRPWRTIDEGFASELRGKLAVVYLLGPELQLLPEGRGPPRRARRPGEGDARRPRVLAPRGPRHRGHRPDAPCRSSWSEG